MDNKECQRKREQGLGEGMVLIGGTVHKVKDILTIKKTFDDMKKNAGTLGEGLYNTLVVSEPIS